METVILIMHIDVMIVEKLYNQKEVKMIIEQEMIEIEKLREEKRQLVEQYKKIEEQINNYDKEISIKQDRIIKFTTKG